MVRGQPAAVTSYHRKAPFPTYHFDRASYSSCSPNNLVKLHLSSLSNWTWKSRGTIWCKTLAVATFWLPMGQLHIEEKSIPTSVGPPSCRFPKIYACAAAATTTALKKELGGNILKRTETKSLFPIHLSKHPHGPEINDFHWTPGFKLCFINHGDKWGPSQVCGQWNEQQTELHSPLYSTSWNTIVPLLLKGASNSMQIIIPMLHPDRLISW